MRQRATQAATKLKRLYEAIEDGLASTDDQDLKDRMRELAVIRDESRADADRAEAAIEKSGPMLTPEILARFSKRRWAAVMLELGAFSQIESFQ